MWRRLPSLGKLQQGGLAFVNPGLSGAGGKLECTSIAALKACYIAGDGYHILAYAMRLHALAAGPIVGVGQIGGLDDVLCHILGEGHVGELHAPGCKSAPTAHLLLQPGENGMRDLTQPCPPLTGVGHGTVSELLLSVGCSLSVVPQGTVCQGCMCCQRKITGT